jgi:hypothetical protein
MSGVYSLLRSVTVSLMAIDSLGRRRTFRALVAGIDNILAASSLLERYRVDLNIRRKPFQQANGKIVRKVWICGFLMPDSTVGHVIWIPNLPKTFRSWSR